MTKTLIPPGGAPQILSATTTAKLARRIQCTIRVLARHLPAGLYSLSAVDILVALHAGEEDARYLSLGDLTSAGHLSEGTTERWVHALEHHGFVDRRGEMLALSATGHELVTNLLEAVYAGQRELD